MTWRLTVLVYSAICTITAASSAVDDQFPAELLYEELIAAIDKVYSLEQDTIPVNSQHFQQQQQQLHHLSAEDNSKQHYYNPTGNGQPMQRSVHENKMPITVKLPALQKTFNVYFPIAKPLMPPKQESNSETVTARFPLKVAPVEMNTVINKPLLQTLSTPLSINKHKKFRSIHKTKTPYDMIELNSASPYEKQQHTIATEQKTSFVEPLNKIVHFNVKLPARIPVKVKYSSPIEVNHSFSGNVGDTTVHREKLVQYLHSGTPSGFQGANKKYSATYKVITPLQKPSLLTEASLSAGNLVKNEGFQAYTTPSSMENGLQQAETGQVTYYFLRNSSGSSANGITDSRIVISQPVYRLR